jgi:hypothetical protein
MGMRPTDERICIDETRTAASLARVIDFCILVQESEIPCHAQTPEGDRKLVSLPRPRGHLDPAAERNFHGGRSRTQKVHAVLRIITGQQVPLLPRQIRAVGLSGLKAIAGT